MIQDIDPKIFNNNFKNKPAEFQDLFLSYEGDTVLARENKDIPEGWAIDMNGNPTTEPETALKGTVLPMGGPKGSALALAVDILSGILSGAEHAPNVKSFHSLQGRTGVGATLVAVDIRKFLDLEEFSRVMDKYIKNFKQMRKANSVSEIYLPGEIEFRRELQSKEHGINLSDQSVEVINNLLIEVGSRLRLEAQS